MEARQCRLSDKHWSGEELALHGYRHEFWGQCKDCLRRVSWARTARKNIIPLVPTERIDGKQFFAFHGPRR